MLTDKKCTSFVEHEDFEAKCINAQDSAEAATETTPTDEKVEVSFEGDGFVAAVHGLMKRHSARGAEILVLLSPRLPNHQSS